MSDQLGSARFQLIIQASLQEYEKQTNIALAKHALAEQLQHCDSAGSVIAILQEQVHACSELRGNDRLLKSLNSAVTVLSALSASVNLGLPISLTKIIYAGIAILIATVEDYSAEDPVVDLLELIESFLKRLDIYIKIRPTADITGVIVDTLVELLSILALATKFITQRQPEKILRKLSGGKYDEMVLERLDRLTVDEARMTAEHILEVFCGLIQNMRAVMDATDDKASVNRVRNALEVMHNIVNDVNKSKRENLEQDLRSWLSPPDPWQNYNTARYSRHMGTGVWFVGGDIFSEWKWSRAGSLLWIHGKPGAGKSVLCSAIIQDIETMKKAGLASLAFFYCDFREDQRKNLRGLISSLLVQLCSQSDSYYDILFKFFSEHDAGSRHPSNEALVGCLKDLLKHSGLAPVYFILDALDECPNTSGVPSARGEVLNFIEVLTKSQFPNLRVCVTSRPATDIKDVLDPLILHSVSLHDESGQKWDIEDYIKSVISTNPKNRRWRAEDKQSVIDVLTEKADGMFRWADCKMVFICGCTPARIRHELADLPETHDGTYLHTLREVDGGKRDLAHRLLHFATVAFRLLRVEELAELVAFDFNAGPIPEYQEGWRVEDPADAVLSTCSSLLAIIDGGNRLGKIVQFSHYSVIEFLTSVRLAEAGDINRYHISTTSAHTIAAKACLSILLHLDEDIITCDSLNKWPLAEYAAEHWADHARFNDVSRTVEDGIKQLLDPSKPHLAVCVWIHNPDTPLQMRTSRPLPLGGTPLHYAALWGLHFIIEFLVIECSQDVDSRHFTNNATPLHLASKHGQVEAARMLIKYGADVAAQNKNRETPLHLAVNRGQVEVARMLIECGADRTAQNDDGLTPLHVALEEDEVGAACMLIEYGTKAAMQIKDGRTLLHLALNRGQVGVARLLIERGADERAQNRDGETLLHLASNRGQANVARMLIECGADVTAQNKYGLTPLHLALIRRHAEVVRLLIENGADVTAQNKDGVTPLHLAVNRGQVEVARSLIERGVDVTAHKDGTTLLHLAMYRGQVEAAWMLTKHDVGVTARNNDGDTPLHLASFWGQVEFACLLMEHGADVTAQNNDGDTPLHLASCRGGVESARLLIEHGADVTAQNNNGDTPLHLASCCGQVESGRLLIEHGIDVTAQNNDGDTPLHWASCWGQVECGRLLIEHGSDVKAQNNDGDTPLHLASFWGQEKSARLLIEHGSDVTAQNKDEKTPLHRASQKGYSKVVYFLLLANGVYAYARDNDNNTPLHWASQQGHLEVVRVLIYHGINVNIRDHSNWTPLHEAAQHGQLQVVQFLLEHGADGNASDQGGWTPLQWPSHNGYFEIVWVLLEHGADANTRDNSNWTPLHGASQRGHYGVAQILLEHGADANSRDDANCTPLHRASQQGHWAVARALLEHGVDANSRDNSNCTPLLGASKRGHWQVAQVLLEHGADTNARDDSNCTPLHDASQRGHWKVARVLLEHGADTDSRDDSDRTPLHLASQGGHFALVGLLVDYGANNDVQNNEDESSQDQLHTARQANALQLILSQ